MVNIAHLENFAVALALVSRVEELERLLKIP
jgi:hypothetical protein